jgi:hypothetical protein
MPRRRKRYDVITDDMLLQTMKDMNLKHNLSSGAKETLKVLGLHFLDVLRTESTRFRVIANRKKLLMKDVRNGYRSHFKKWGGTVGEDAVEQFKNSKAKDKGKRLRMHVRAGLRIYPARVKRVLREHNSTVTDVAAVYTTALLSSVIKVLLDRANIVTTAKKTITEADLRKAMTTTTYLAALAF